MVVPETPVVAALQAVHMSYNGLEVVHGISFDVHRGEAVLVTGPSASGKSTSIRLLPDIEQPTSGDIELFGRTLGALSEAEKRQLIARKVSFVQQDPALDGGLTVFNNLTLTAQALDIPYGIPGNRLSPRHLFLTARASRERLEAIQQRAARLSVLFGITDLLDRPANGDLSGGQRAKIALARALVEKPELLVLDEPTAAVDPKGRGDIYSRLRHLQQREGFAVVMVSHDDSAIGSFASREVVIDSGRVVEPKAPTAKSRHARRTPEPISRLRGGTDTLSPLTSE